jgi:hypothetical protein
MGCSRAGGLVGCSGVDRDGIIGLLIDSMGGVLSLVMVWLASICWFE